MFKQYFITIPPEGKVVRKYEQIARYDHDLLLDPGRYELFPMTINWKQQLKGKPYWLVALIPATRIHDGVGGGKRGDRSIFWLTRYGYSLEGLEVEEVA